jgi:crossover junction endodeoxyribonuclease RusA
MRLILPLPPRELAPNRRPHWAAKAKAVREYRTRAWAVARNVSNGQRLDWERAEVRTVFMLPDRRRRDPDNLMAAMKAAWDGIVDAHVLTDDRYLILHPPTLMVDRARPRVEITLTDAP